jgi:ribosomal-protein-alanine N-acetyltransferase
MSSIPTLDTQRLHLRAFGLADALEVRRLAGDPAVAATTLNIPHPYPEGAAEAWIAAHEAHAAEGRSFSWAIVRQEDGALMGAIGLVLTPVHLRAEMGYWLGVPFWNQGYMTEAARRVIAFGFAQLGLHRLQAGAFPRNTGSWRVMEKAGMQREGVLRGYARKEAVFEDVAMYSILRVEWAQTAPSAAEDGATQRVV